MTKQSKNVYENNQHYCESSERKKKTVDVVEIDFFLVFYVGMLE